MKSKAIGPIVIFAVTTTLFSTGASAADVRVLHNFGGSATDGLNPSGQLVIDKVGNLYGETEHGGARGGGGTVFRLSLKADGEWTETVLHSFGTGFDGSDPIGGLVFDTSGNLYGVTEVGGTRNWGTIFELSPAKDGEWTETVLYSFVEYLHGFYPVAGLIFDSAGNLYGTTSDGGPNERGTVFELSPSESGKWKQTVLHSFEADTEGESPQARLTFDAAGNLYGTTLVGGPNHSPGNTGGGTVFELTPAADGWTETTLYAFVGETKDGANSPSSELILDEAGNLYGTDAVGGPYDGGAIFELIRGEGGGWTAKFLHYFGSSPTGGNAPFAGLILDNSGNLFGTTRIGATYGDGEIFELTPDGNGRWTHTVLHEFNSPNGRFPSSSLMLDTAGSLYGTAQFGGSHDDGTVFEVVR